MTMMQATDVTLWLVDEVPVALLHHGRRWRVIDTPTLLGNESAVLGFATHESAEPWYGWRFMGRSPEGETLIFDVRHTGRDSWDLITTHR